MGCTLVPEPSTVKRMTTPRGYVTIGRRISERETPVDHADYMRHAIDEARLAAAAGLARVERVVFGVRDPKGGACGSVLNIPEERRLNHHIEVVGGVLEEESRALLQEFFKELRQKPPLNVNR